LINFLVTGGIVPLFDLKFLSGSAAAGAGTSNWRHEAERVRWTERLRLGYLKTYGKEPRRGGIAPNSFHMQGQSERGGLPGRG
jgi:hypothetical protein